MNKYIYTECYQDYWPNFKSIVAKSYDDAIEKLVENYTNALEDDEIAKISEFEDLQEYLNREYNIVISDLIDYDEL